MDLLKENSPAAALLDDDDRHLELIGGFQRFHAQRPGVRSYYATKLNGGLNQAVSGPSDPMGAKQRHRESLRSS